MDSKPDKSNTDGELPAWALKFARRAAGLPPGCYQIVLNVGEDNNWSISQAGGINRVVELPGKGRKRGA